MAIIKPDRKQLYDSIFIPLKNDMMSRNDSINDDVLKGLEFLSETLTNAIETYVSQIIVEINPGVQVEIVDTDTSEATSFSGKTITKGTSKS